MRWPGVSKELRAILTAVEGTPGFSVELTRNGKRVQVKGPAGMVFLKVGSSAYHVNEINAQLKKAGFGAALQLPPSEAAVTDIRRVTFDDEGHIQWTKVLHEPEPEPTQVELDLEPQEQPMALEPPPENPKQDFGDAFLAFLADHPGTSYSIDEVINNIGTKGLSRQSCGPRVSQGYLRAEADSLWLNVRRTKGVRPIRYWWEDDPREVGPVTREGAPISHPLVGTFCEVLVAMPTGELLQVAEDGTMWMASPLNWGR
jgi:hypothetical protein